jgi:hypothetical protein
MSFPITFPAPGPKENFKIVSITPDEVPFWYHVYSSKPFPNTAGAFAKGWGETRFAPITQSDGTWVHTYYAASNIKCALNESILHDVPCGGQFYLRRLVDEGRHLAKIEFDRTIDVVSFHSTHLPLLKLSRELLIDSDAAAYVHSRPWAEAAFQQALGAEGVGYTSKRNDTGRCVMLFEQRLTKPYAGLATPFRVVEDIDISASTEIRKELMELMKSQDISWI